MMQASQRTGDFRGGIQKGMNATDIDAKHLDVSLKELQREILKEIGHLGYNVRPKIPKAFLEEYGVETGFMPDGGVWYREGVVVAMFEGKKQGARGNACERWFKNARIASSLFPRARYVSFGAGPGFAKGEGSYKVALTGLALDDRSKRINVLYDKGVSWFVNENRFDRATLKEYMLKAILL
jgi:hypothetical protein